MPHLVQMDKRYRDAGLVIIGAESQNSSDKAIKKITDKAKVEFTITKGVQGPVQVRGIPTALVFDVSGKMIFKGNPGNKEFDKTIKDALKDYKPAEEKNESKKITKKEPLVSQRSWSNNEGKKIIASVTEATQEIVTFKLQNGKTVPYEISKLSATDQQLIKNALEQAAKKSE